MRLCVPIVSSSEFVRDVWHSFTKLMSLSGMKYLSQTVLPNILTNSAVRIRWELKIRRKNANGTLTKFKHGIEPIQTMIQTSFCTLYSINRPK